MTEKVSVRIPHELTKWMDAEAGRRKCDRSTVINDALRLAATAGEIKQISLLIQDLAPLITNRLDRLESHTTHALRMAGQAAISANAIAQKEGLFDQVVKPAYDTWQCNILKGE